MSFAGVSVIRDGRLWPSASVFNCTSAARGYHLLVVEGYSRTKADVPNGDHIESRPFRVGGYLWLLRCHPNGSSSARAGYVSASLLIAQDVAKPVKAQFEISFINQFGRQRSAYIRSGSVRHFRGKSCGTCYSNFISRDDLEDSEHLKDDSFTIRCDIIVIEDDDAKGTGATSSFVTVPPPDVQQHFTDLFMAKEGNDVTFEVGGETISAHRRVLAARSRVFKAELFGPMKEGTSTASAIHIDDMEPRVFRAMLAFIYCDSEPEMEKEDGEDAICQLLLVAADRYDLQRLKLICEAKICGFIGVNTTTTILELAENHHCDGLRKACYNFLGAPGNLRAVTTTDGFDNLITSHPSVMKELIAMLAP
ncbi:BTB/POZ and MATH domain-containing protein 2-like [Triticum aestivum]|uniref:BTB/POZ and MATH domain-containing protein 2-like n=1 Tax=Triticum aestivum TaxID=4565 RepID=UPI001D01E165|nr:BTB/POZ and MATH domain-containing protein 2-like [Triticum aestivum]